jgi:hypothetical protein
MPTTFRLDVIVDILGISRRYIGFGSFVGTSFTPTNAQVDDDADVTAKIATQKTSVAMQRETNDLTVVIILTMLALRQHWKRVK